MVYSGVPVSEVDWYPEKTSKWTINFTKDPAREREIITDIKGTTNIYSISDKSIRSEWVLESKVNTSVTDLDSCNIHKYEDHIL